jgi:hypothetical protein
VNPKRALYGLHSEFAEPHVIDPTYSFSFTHRLISCLSTGFLLPQIVPYFSQLV